MKVLIVEDEPLAAGHLTKLISEYDPAIEVIKVIDSVKKSIDWFNNHSHPDLLFLDIQLADGLSFDIFKQCEIKTPIIFTTAYDEYAIKAFKVNSIDYLLKPISPEELRTAIEKFKNTKNPDSNIGFDLKSMEHAIQLLTKEYKNRFVIKVGEHIRFVPIEDISFFYSLEKATFIQTTLQKNYCIDFSLDDLENLVDPAKFFRINRKYIVSLASISDIISYSNSRLALKLKGCNFDDVIVSREKVSSFKEWLDD